jgi:cyclase
MTLSKQPGDRRSFLQGMLGGAAGLALLPVGLATALAQAPSASIAVTPLGDGLQLVSGAGGNVVSLANAAGVLLVDGGAAPHSAELLKRIADSRPVQVLINTHWHPEQTGSNEALGRAGARIIAHENTKLWLGTQIDVQWQKKTYPPRPAEALPTETIYTTAKLEFGNEVVEYGHLPQAHTDGDLYVFLPGRNLLFTGDVMAVGSYPILDWSTGGWIGGMVNATRKLLEMSDASTRIVPGLGPVQTRADLQAQYDMLTVVRGRLVDMLKKGMSPADMLAARPTAEFDARWGDPTLLVTNAYPGLWAHVRELGGIL